MRNYSFFNEAGKTYLTCDGVRLGHYRLTIYAHYHCIVGDQESTQWNETDARNWLIEVALN
jgi:hypothetical protein